MRTILHARRTSSATWDKIRVEFERGDADIAHLAMKWSVGTNSIRERARVGRWKGYFPRAEARSGERLRARRVEQIGVARQMAEELGYTPTKAQFEARGIFFGRFHPFSRASELVIAAQLLVRRRASGRSAAQMAAFIAGTTPRRFKVRCCYSCGQKTTSDPCTHCGVAWDATPVAA